MRPLLLSPAATPSLARLQWEHAGLQACLTRLLQVLDMAAVDAPGDLAEELESTIAQAQRHVGLVWEGSEDLWQTPGAEHQEEGSDDHV